MIRPPRTVLIVGGLVLACFAIEASIRLVDLLAGRGFFSQHRNYLHEATPLVPFRTFGTDMYVEVNGQRFIVGRHGERYPLRKRDGAFRIVCLGGSTTEQRSADGLQYPIKLQELLRQRLGRADIEVINVGFSAYSTPHFLIQLELDVLSWQPDLLILSENINDLSASYFPLFTPDYSNKYRHPFFSIADYRSRFTRANVLFQDCQLYWLLRLAAIRLVHADVATTIRRKCLGDEPLAEARQVFERNLKSFMTLAQAHKISVLLATQPLETSEELFVKQMAYKPYNEIVVYPLHEEFVRHHLAYNDVIERVAQETGAWFIDNDVEFRSERAYFIDMVHYSDAGLERLAANYARFLIENRIVDRSIGDPE